MLKINSCKRAPKTQYDFSIFRIIGGELPPRDIVGSRIKTIKFILENEILTPDTHRGWILNAIPDMDYRREICSLLDRYKEFFVVLPMHRKNFLAASSYDEKIVHAIPINKARNLAIAHGAQIARFTACLDGDCFIDASTWNEIKTFIKKDQITNPTLKNYGIPHVRSSVEEALSGKKPNSPLAEPMPVFRNDSKIKFNDSIPFGQGDKLELLFRLGYSKQPFKNNILLNEEKCKNVGYVHHLATGEELTEKNNKVRVELRNESIKNLIEKLDSFVPPVRLPNEYWKQIQGFFDYQGFYSQMAFEGKDDSVFVEVGSWLGTSAIYLATEIKNRNKNIKLICVDTWEGTVGDEHLKNLKEKLPKPPYEVFLENVKKSGIEKYISSRKTTSLQAAQSFKDESIDFVFIDAAHSYRHIMDDIKAWYPKVKKGGVISGHDYMPTHPKSIPGVVRAVNEFFKCKDLELGPAGRTWMHRKK